MGHLRPLFVYFRLFKRTLQFLQQKYVKKCPSSKQCWDWNPLLSGHESPLITTIPGLPPIRTISLLCTSNQYLLKSSCLRIISIIITCSSGSLSATSAALPPIQAIMRLPSLQSSAENSMMPLYHSSGSVMEFSSFLYEEKYCSSTRLSGSNVNHKC